MSEFIATHMQEALALLHRDTDQQARIEVIEPVEARLVIINGPSVVLLKITAPKGMKTDLGSIPQIFWWIPGFSKLGRMTGPCIIHDALYSKQSAADILIPDEKGGMRRVTRAESDTILRELGKESGENEFVRWTYWLAVRLFGKSHWRK